MAYFIDSGWLTRLVKKNVLENIFFRGSTFLNEIH